LQDDLGRIEAAGGRLVAVSAAKPDEVDALVKRFGLTFPVLSDPDLRIAASYGVRQKGLDIALPSTFVVDAGGIVRWVRVGKNPLDRPSTEEIVAALRAH
jgi:thioredoxin-dependent peroxiredoxin